MNNYNDDLLDDSSLFKEIETPKYVSQPTGGKTYKPSTTYGIDDKYKNYKPDFSNSYTYTEPNYNTQQDNYFYDKYNVDPYDKESVHESEESYKPYDILYRVSDESEEEYKPIVYNYSYSVSDYSRHASDYTDDDSPFSFGDYGMTKDPNAYDKYAHLDLPERKYDPYNDFGTYFTPANGFKDEYTPDYLKE